MSDITAEKVSYRVTFADVGRDKRTWTVTIEQQPTEAILERLVRKSKALMSRDIWCDFDEDLEHGVIGAGMRVVGSFRVVELKEASA